MSILSLDQMLSPRFTVRDLTPTSTGISNSANSSYLEPLKSMASALEELTNKLGSFRIASGYRNPQVNLAVGGSSTSRHMTGEAVDIVPLMQGSEKYWARILADTSLKKRFGEISYKKHQGSIHLTLPYLNSYGAYVTASPRVADKEAGRVVYRSIASDDVAEYLNKYGLSVTKVGIGLGVLALGTSGLAFIYILKRRKS